MSVHCTVYMRDSTVDIGQGWLQKQRCCLNRQADTAFNLNALISLRSILGAQILYKSACPFLMYSYS